MICDTGFCNVRIRGKEYCFLYFFLSTLFLPFPFLETYVGWHWDNSFLKYSLGFAPFKKLPPNHLGKNLKDWKYFLDNFSTTDKI